MRRVLMLLMVAAFVSVGQAQTSFSCSCGAHPPGPPPNRALKPYANAPEDLRPFSKFTTPYYEHYQNLIEYNGAARDLPDGNLNELSEIRIGFLAPLYDHPEQALGKRMLNGAQMAIDEVNVAGGYCGKPFHLVVHNDYDNWQTNGAAAPGVSKDSAIWGSASNDAVRMIYDDKVWAMFGSISAESTHIALRLSLKAETPIVNSASTDPTIPETIIPWYFTDIQDDRVQGYTLARHIYTELGLRRVALLRVNDRYGRFGVMKFRDASRRLGHPVVIEQKFRPGDTDFRRQLRVIQDSRVDAIVIWADIGPTAGILQQIQELGIKQRVFGSHRTIGEELIKLAGPSAEGFEGLYPYDPTRSDPRWLDFVSRYEARFHEKPDHFASLAYDAMQVLLNAICRAGLNRGRIRDALTGITSHKGVTGEMIMDPNCKNIAPMYLGRVHNGVIEYRRVTMDKPGATSDGTEKMPPDPALPAADGAIGQRPAPAKPYARVGEEGVQYAGPTINENSSRRLEIGVFGPRAEQVVSSPEVLAWIRALGPGTPPVSLVAIPSQLSWGKASNELVKAVYEHHVVAVIALDRPSSQLAEQIAVKSFVPVIALCSDRALTTTNIPWIFRLPDNTPVPEALQILSDAIERAGASREKIRGVLASGEPVAGVRFQSTGEVR